MGTDRKYEEAIHHLAEGNFERAKKAFDSLLESNPENSDYISGFYLSSYWDNRIERIHISREGRDRAALLLEFLKEFEAQYSQKQFSKSSSYWTCRNAIILEVVDQVKISIQKEGNLSISSGMIVELIYQLLLSGEVTSASEILKDVSGLEKGIPELLFLRAECMYQSGNEAQGLLLYREAFLKDPSLLRIDAVRSEPILNAISALKEIWKDSGDLREAIPVYCLENGIFKDIRKMNDREIDQLRLELFRLRDSLSVRKGDYDFKVKCRMIQLCCALLDSRSGTYYGENAQEAKRILDSLDPNFYHKRSVRIR
ncbi:hypothetical protein CH373_07900 [Leptospira perolatii]|uniref:Tetratricopeptide repeat protein n=1 Tax=Leptospira perolatii TaxID=2023191 RepID=A0A2M9ZN45_9LEPT|nr:hypothetical protein [Leptospira perolatii]PJZ68948.1 hypothetical protein CH360_13815 [Leptospira perolatii]PJZ73434.1 hypothetical protein CH373_07900 [Leptospira perolatii]